MSIYSGKKNIFLIVSFLLLFTLSFSCIFAPKEGGNKLPAPAGKWHEPIAPEIVIENLIHSFPEKSKSEVYKLARRNIHHFCDSFIESLAALHMPEKELKKRFRIKNLETLEELYKSGSDVMLLAMHYGNWEWFSLLPALSSYTVLGVYKTLNNTFSC